MEHHARPAVRHDLADLCPHSGLVALDGASVARSLVLVRALPRSFQRVLYDAVAFRAKICMFFAAPDMAMAMAVDTCHGHQRLLVFFEQAVLLAVYGAIVSHAGPFIRRCVSARHRLHRLLPLRLR